MASRGKQSTESLFSPANLNRRIAAVVPAASMEQALGILARLDQMATVTSTDKQRRGLQLGAKMRALYLSGGDVPALRRATDMAMRDHRDLHQESEDPILGWPGIEPRVPGDTRTGYERFIDWVAE